MRIRFFPWVVVTSISLLACTHTTTSPVSMQLSTQKDVQNIADEGLRTAGNAADVDQAVALLKVAAEPEQYQKKSLLAELTADLGAASSTSSLRGDAQAQRELALFYREGNGVDADPTQSVKLYTQSALQGDAASQAALGQAYEHGLGVTSDIIQAFAWYQLSADQHDIDGLAAVSRLRPTLTQQQWNNAKALHDQLSTAVKP